MPSMYQLYPSLAPPLVSGNAAPLKTLSNNPQLIGIQDGRKIYRIRGVPFEVDEHYELIKPIGLGAYGLVCSAVDLRWVPESPFYDEQLVNRETKGGGYVFASDGGLVAVKPFTTIGTQRNVPPPELSAFATSGHDLETLAKVEFRRKLPDRQGLNVAVAPDRNEGHTLPASSPRKAPTMHFEPYQKELIGAGIPSPYVAIKKVPKLFHDLIDGKRVLREVKALRYLRGHPNVLRLHDILLPRQNEDEFNDLYIVTELLDTDLALVLRTSQNLGEEHYRFMMFQLLKCLVYVHSSGMIHRDLKPGNLLLTTKCELKVGDFGLSRGGVPLNGIPSTEMMGSTAHGVRPYVELTDYVITRYYRPPELLLMCSYNHSADIWSAGCIFAEMIVRNPVFPGKDYLSQLRLIAETTGLLGRPQSAEEVDAMFDGGFEGKEYLKDLLFGMRSKNQTLRGPSGGSQWNASDETGASEEEQLQVNLLGGQAVSPEAVSLMASLLNFNPQKRPTAVEALRHPYFSSLYEVDDEIERDLESTIVSSGTRLQSDVPPHLLHYDSEEEDQMTMWAFDQRVLDERQLRRGFMSEMRRYQRRRDRAKRCTKRSH